MTDQYCQTEELLFNDDAEDEDGFTDHLTDEEDEDDNLSNSDNEAYEQCMELEDNSDGVKKITNERKFIVFQSCLFSLFSVCFICSSKCNVFITKMLGSFISLKQICPSGHYKVWDSQPCHGTLPFGNLLTAANILYTGGNPARILNLFKNFNIATISIRTYNLIQSSYLMPAVNRVWLSEQEKILAIHSNNNCTVAGYARCCSPGHTAKYASYSLMSLQTSQILDVQLIQVNKVTNSFCKELEGLKRCFNYLKNFIK